jgi:hypothetical protein
MTQTINYPFTTSSNYTFNTDKIEVTGGVAQLKSPFQTDNPTIETNVTFDAEGFEVFTTALTVTGNDAIKFTRKIDGVEYYWNGSAWAVSSGYSQSNTTSEMHNSGAFIGGETSIVIYLHSDDGSTTPSIDNLLIVYDAFGGSGSLPELCNVTGYILDANNQLLTSGLIVATPVIEGFIEGKNWLVNLTPIQSNLDQTGRFELELIRSTEYIDSVKYNFTIVPTSSAISPVRYYNISIPDQPTADFDELITGDNIMTTSANRSLSNLSDVAINTSLVSDTDNTDDIGTSAIRWKDIYGATLNTGNTAADTLTLRARDVDGASWTNFVTLTANNTPTCALSGDVTGVTQSAADNSTKLATTAYVDNAAIPLSVFYGVDSSANLGDYRVRAIGTTGSYRFTFNIPNDFTSLTKLVMIISPTSGAAGSGKDIDLSSNYGSVGEAQNEHSESDTTTTYDFTGDADKFVELDISIVFSSIAAGDICGLFVDHKGTGGTINYFGVRLDYTK